MNLADIVRGDGGLGIVSYYHDPITVTYTPKTVGNAQDRIYKIVNTISIPVYITGVESSFVVGTIPINTVAGVTLFTTNLNFAEVIYDVDQCSGNGYYVYHQNGSKINLTNDILLYHELAHAYHVGISDVPFDPSGNPNVPAGIIPSNH